MSKYILSALIIFCILTPELFAETRNKTSGDIAFEHTGPEKKDNYALQQSDALQYAQAVSNSINSSNYTTVSLSPAGVFYLNGLYLYCSAKTGACPFILDTILSGEFLNSRGQEKKSCPNMQAFWENWVKNAFEERLSYLAPVGSVATIKTFNESKRSRYIKCDETLAKFSPDAEIKRNLALTVKLIEQIQLKKLNILEETGAIKAK